MKAASAGRPNPYPRRNDAVPRRVVRTAPRPRTEFYEQNTTGDAEADTGAPSEAIRAITAVTPVAESPGGGGFGDAAAAARERERAMRPLPSPSPYYAAAQSEAAPYVGLIQLRPGPQFTPGRPPPIEAAPHAHRSRRAPLSRWIFVYVPAVLFVGLVLYVVCELAMKHYALSNLQDQMRALPEMPATAAPGESPLLPPPPPFPANAAVSAPPSDVSFALRSVVMRPRGAW